MSIKQSFSLAIKSLLSSKMRTFLTMLGIIIGVCAVIVLVSVVQGSTLFTIDKDNEILGYQMMKDGTYISPMEMLLISG